MTVDDYPVRPEMRIVQRHQLPGFIVTLLEQPDIAVDEPYIVAVESEHSAFGACRTQLPFTTKTEAVQTYDDFLNRYLDLPGNDSLREVIEAVRVCMSPNTNRFDIRRDT